MTNEQYLAGTILLEDSVIWGLDGLVTADDFQSEHCRAIFEAARALKDEGSTVDPVTIMSKARQNGVDLPIKFIKELMEIVPTTANFAEYAKRVADDARTRRIKELAVQIQEDNASTPDELIAKVQQETDRLKDGRNNEAKQVIVVTSATDLQQEDLPPTVFLITGILPEGTSIISAASKIGKSWMVLDMGLSIAAGNPFMGHLCICCPYFPFHTS